MEKDSVSLLSWSLGSFWRKCLFSVLSVGPLPTHIAFIMDGNRRYAKKQNMVEGAGHRAGYRALMKILCYCYELGVRYVTVYAFSIDNFKRRPEEVQSLMGLMLEKIEELLLEESIVNEYGIRIYFIGNLKLLSEPVRLAAERAMTTTALNTKAVLLICVGYTSYDEIVNAVEKSCKVKIKEAEASNGSEVFNGRSGVEEEMKRNGVPMHVQGFNKDKYDEDSSVIEVDEESKKRQLVLPTIKVVDIEKHLYMSVAPEPDMLIRTSGESRLSNFLLWQTTNCSLYSPAALWPDFGFWHLVWVVLNFQRSHSYFEKKKKQL